MRRRKSKKDTIVFLIIVVAALGISLLTARFLPVSGEVKRLVFFLLIPIIALIGVVVRAKVGKR